MSEELYKEYRPETLDEMVGNEITIKEIQGALDNDAVPHLILLSGPSGCGKTTIARILRDELNCSEYDYVEMNCATDGGIDKAREIVKSMRYKPMQGDVKVWLLDECQKLTPAAINAYLKPFEDTPEWVYFICATSEPEKLEKTKEGRALRTRATHWAVEALDTDEVESLVKDIAEEEELEIPDKVVSKIAEASGGSSRLALVMLQQMRFLKPEEMTVQVEKVIKQEATLYELFKELMWGKKNWNNIIDCIAGLDGEPEGWRCGLLKMASGQLLKKSGKSWDKSFKIIDCMSSPFYSNGQALFAHACFDIMFGE